jgi:hypothetical protein
MDTRPRISVNRNDILKLTPSKLLSGLRTTGIVFAMLGFIALGFMYLDRSCVASGWAA